MLYAILCYDSERTVGSWTKAEDDAVMERLGAVQDVLRKQKKLGPVARLGPTAAARTLRKGSDTVVLDGPFAETKEALLGFYVVECASLDEAVEIARKLGRASSSEGAFEVRALRYFDPGSFVSLA